MHNSQVPARPAERHRENHVRPEGAQRLGRLCLGLFAATATAGLSPARLRAEELRVIGRLSRLPRALPCVRRLRRAIGEYEVVAARRTPRVKAPRVGSRIQVSHSCPMRRRALTPEEGGDAGPLRVGRLYRLQLRRTPSGHLRAMRTDEVRAPPKLVVAIRGGAGRRQSVTFRRYGPILIGGDYAADLVLSGRGVAGRHVSIERRASGIWIKPLAGLTRIGQMVLRRPTRLPFGAELTIGRYRVSIR